MGFRKQRHGWHWGFMRGERSGCLSCVLMHSASSVAAFSLAPQDQSVGSGARVQRNGFEWQGRDVFRVEVGVSRLLFLGFPCVWTDLGSFKVLFSLSVMIGLYGAHTCGQPHDFTQVLLREQGQVWGSQGGPAQLRAHLCNLHTLNKTFELYLMTSQRTMHKKMHRLPVHSAVT